MQPCCFHTVLLAGLVSSGIPQVSTILLCTVSIACCMQDSVYGAAGVVIG